MASGRLADYMGVGVIASRPATPSLYSATLGLWFATDTGVLSAWDGSAWEDTSTLSAPSITGIGDYANDAAAAVGLVPIGGVYRNGSVLQIRVT